MKWFRVPDRIYFEADSIQYISKLYAKKAFIVTDRTMDDLGYVKRVMYQLKKTNTEVNIFMDVEPDPSFETVLRGAEMMRAFEPDVIIALGGGSPIDAAKAMWMFYEHDDLNAEKLRADFMDVIASAYRYTKDNNKAKFVAVPTTSGTGTEVTAFAVITDKKTNVKYPLADYALTPDVAIVDPELVMTVPPAVSADTGMDVLTHAIESYVSTVPSDYTDPLALKAIELVFNYLPKVYEDGSDKLAREKMHNASCIAGMAFTNALLGINHSLAHNLGATFKIPHGRVNAILLPYVIRYNGEVNPTDYPNIGEGAEYTAPKRFQYIAKKMKLYNGTPEQGVESLAQAVTDLMKEMNMPTSLSECGVEKGDFDSKIDKIVQHALEDPCTGANPRIPTADELKDILKKAF